MSRCAARQLAPLTEGTTGTPRLQLGSVASSKLVSQLQTCLPHGILAVSLIGQYRTGEWCRSYALGGKGVYNDP